MAVIHTGCRTSPTRSVHCVYRNQRQSFQSHIQNIIVRNLNFRCPVYREILTYSQNIFNDMIR